MTRYVAFLSGINLGGRRVRMADLRAHFAELEVEDVRTFIASGNVIFDAELEDVAAFEAEAEDHLAERLGFETNVLVRHMGRLLELVGLELIGPGEDGVNPYVIFLRREPPDDVRAKLRGLESAGDRFRIEGREVVWLRHGRLTDSPIKTRDLRRAFGDIATTRRRITTLERVVEKFGPDRST